VELPHSIGNQAKGGISHAGNFENNALARRVERIHDVRMVRPPKKPQSSKMVSCCHRKLGHRAF
jgi:hypothetical protein